LLVRTSLSYVCSKIQDYKSSYIEIVIINEMNFFSFLAKEITAEAATP